MKKLPLTLAILVSTSALTTMGNTAPTVYGKVNVSLENADIQSSDTKNFTLSSNASRFGLKGKKDLEKGLTAVYKVEYETAVDDGDAILKQRNIYGGLKGSWGQVIVGKFDSPLKKSQAKIDLFNDLKGDIKHIMVGETRASNLIQYSTPKMNGISVSLALQPGEDSGNDVNNRDGIADGVSASIVYTGLSNLYVALAVDSDIKQGSKGLDVTKGDQADITRLVASYKLGNALTLGGLYQIAEKTEANNTQDTSIFASAAYKLKKGVKLKAQYGQTDNDAGDNTKTLLSLGADYSLGNKSKLFAFATQVDQDIANKKETYIGLGFETKF